MNTYLYRYRYRYRYKVHTYKDIDVYIYFNSDIGGLRHPVVRVSSWSFGTVLPPAGMLMNTYLYRYRYRYRYKIHTYKDIYVYIYLNSDVGGLRHTVVRVSSWSFRTVLPPAGMLMNTYLYRHRYRYRYKIHTYKDIDVYIYLNSDVGGLRHTVVRVSSWSIRTVLLPAGMLMNTYL